MDFELRSLRGGMNDWDPPSALPDDQCTVALNVEFHRSMLGERRAGCDNIDLTGSDLASCDRIVWLHRHLPGTDLADAQLWALGIDGSTPVLAYKDTSWHTVSMSDALTVDGVSEYQVTGVSLHGKLFIAYNSGVDRLHVWDGTSLRRVGLPEPANAPTAADSGSGTFIGTRYYRVREAVQSGGITVRRGEPSPVLTFEPSGSGTGATVTKPTLSSEATHWELEASLDEANFYRIATTAVGTSTATDTTAFADGYEAFTLSEDIGDYTLIGSARYLTTDDDRLIWAGSFEDEGLSSRVGWTPVGKADGIGNDERMEADTDPFVDLDTQAGGGLTGISAGIQGYLYAFKWDRTYQGVRSGLRSAAYKFYNLSKERGAVPGSVIGAVDQNGNSVLYGLDPAVGPIRIGSRGGLQQCGRDILTTWRGVNKDATKVVSRGLYDPETLQMQWFVATGASDVPNYGLVLQTNEMVDTSDTGARRGWSVWSGTRTKVLAICLFSDNIDDDDDRNMSLRPFIGVEGGGLILRCDTGTTDNGDAYAARIVTKPFALATILNDSEVKAGALLAKAVSGASVNVKAIRDFGLETKTVSGVTFTATGSETQLIKDLTDLGMSEARTVQFEFVDVASPSARWELNGFVVRAEPGQAA